MTTARDPWFHREARDAVAARLFCFPPAGAGAQFFRGWSDVLPAHVEILGLRLPGRESRLGEPPNDSMAEIVSLVNDALAPYEDLPFAYYGHSMGSLIAVELAERRRARGGSLPTGLIVSGRRPPHLPLRRDPLHALPDDALWDKLRDLGGLHPRVWREPEMKALLLPAVRADLVAVECHPYDGSAEPLPCPLWVLAAEEDPMVSAAEFAAWSERTQGACRVMTVPGGHFFMKTAEETFLAALAEAVAEAIPG